MGKIIDDRHEQKQSYGTLQAGTTFTHCGWLYMKTDLRISEKSTYVSVKLSTGEVEEFCHDDVVQIVSVEHHIVD